MGKIEKAAPNMKQPIFEQQEKTGVIVTTTEEKELFLMVGNERIQISGYTTKSIGGGLTEINITIVGDTMFTELSTISK